jgi:hypothetical protein
MTSEQFCYWLQGFMELSNLSEGIGRNPTEIIREHLQLVFQKKTSLSLGDCYTMPTASYDVEITHIKTGIVGTDKELDKMVNYDLDLEGKVVSVGTISARTFERGGSLLNKKDFVSITPKDLSSSCGAYRFARRHTDYLDCETTDIKLVLEVLSGSHSCEDATRALLNVTKIDTALQDFFDYSNCGAMGNVVC